MFRCRWDLNVSLWSLSWKIKLIKSKFYWKFSKIKFVLISPGKATSRRVQQPTRQMATPLADKPPIPRTPASSAASGHGADPDLSISDPAAQPVSSRMATWQQRVSKSTPSKEEEPTAYPVNARMTAWEEMSASNKVSYIKKVDPGSAGSNTSPKKSPKKGVGKSPVKAIGNDNSNMTAFCQDLVANSCCSIQ